MKFFASLLIGLFLIFSSQASAATLQEAGLSGKLPSGWHLNQEFEFQISTAKKAEGFIPSSLNADFKYYNGRKSWVLTSQSEVDDGQKLYYTTIIWLENNFLYTALFWAYNEKDSLNYPKNFFDSLDAKLARSSTKASPDWVEPETSFLFPCPPGWAIKKQQTNSILFVNQSNPRQSLSIEVTPPLWLGL